MVGYYFKIMKLKYKNELIKSMKFLGGKKDTIFLGQSIKFTGNAIYNTLTEVPSKKKLNYLFLKILKWGCLWD